MRFESGSAACCATLLSHCEFTDGDAFDRMKATLIGVLRSRFPSLSADDLDDVVADALAKAVEIPERFDPTRRPEPWLLRIASNLACDRAEAQRGKEMSHLDEGNDEFADNPRWRHKGDDPLEIEEFSGWLRKVVRRLSDLEIPVVELYVFEDLGVAEIARLLERSERLVKEQLHRGMERLRAALADEPWTEGAADARARFKARSAEQRLREIPAATEGGRCRSRDGRASGDRPDRGSAQPGT